PRQARGHAGPLLTQSAHGHAAKPVCRRIDHMIASTLLSPEAKLILHALESSPDIATASTLLQDPEFDWDCLVNLAQKEKATTSLSNMLRRVPADVMPQERAAQISRLSAVTQFRMLHLEQLLAGALETLSDR